MRFQDIAGMSTQALGKNRARTLLTTLGIVIGVAAVIVMVSLGQGAQMLVQRQLQSMGTNILYVMPGAALGAGGARSGTDASNGLTEEDVAAIQREAATVAHVSPIVTASGQAVFGNQNWSSRIEGVNESYLDIRAWGIADGEFISPEDVRSASRVVVLGKTVADNLFQGSDPIGETIRVRNLPYRVIGVLTEKGQAGPGGDQDDILLLPYTTVQKKMQNGAFSGINRIAVSASSESLTDAAAQEITSLLRERRGLREGVADNFRVNNLTDIAEAAQQTARVMTLLLGSVAAVSLVVGGIGIMNIMLVSVRERTREIGIRMAIGSRGSFVRLQFLAESLILCMFGGAIGVIAGAGGSILVAWTLGWPTAISVTASALAFSIAAATGIFFGYYPAHKAASLEPIVALRYE